ncbi:MAG: Tetratricopeptide repeat domain protein [Candidatus Magasanikbacteria bacterium GW2011_GWC2_37_14]|uniref:Tetratricopeptide repeat domain protein n=1 Tax=Candidatus Magasanikbacteria bacterium GW2011_GWC2_37_14 TaxID=1619046 RepID=A0A0G0IUP4_9BACT|nr:MAG: Tetratricopeptide repeat domain protein [Candidatus Magasanikbacteria bacterium GW2011_GWC2_37_14]
MNKIIEKIAKYLIIASFFVPLIVLPTSYIFPFIVPKILWFRSISLLIFASYLLLLFSNWQKFKIKFNFLNIAVGLFFLSFIVSTFVGVDWYKSFWDSHERMLGLFTLFHYLLYYLAVSRLINGWPEWKVILRWFLGAGLIVMVIGGMQQINPELLINRGAHRVSATLGNAIYFSGYGLFLFLLGLLLAIKEKKTTLRLGSGQAFWFWYACIGSLFGFLGIFWGGTRGTTLGLLVSLAVIFFGYVITTKEHKKLRQMLLFLSIFFIVVLGILFVYRKNETIKSIPTLGRLLNASITEGSGLTRYMAWGIAVEGFKEKPVFGWGPNNYYYAFNKYYNPAFLEHGWTETWFDNAHSVIFNTLAVQGFTGLGAYLLMFIAGAWMLIKAYRNKGIDQHILVLSMAFLAGHFVHNATVFENPTSYLYFFFFLAFINSQTADNKQQITDNKKTSEISVGLLVTIGLILLLIIYSTNINPGRANNNTLQTLMAFSTGKDVFGPYEIAQSTPTPHIDDIRSDFARTAIQALPQIYQSKQTDLANKLADLVINELQKNLVLHPMDIRTNLALSQVYGLRAQAENNGQWLLKSEQILNQALSYSPKRQQVLFVLSSVELGLGKVPESLKLIQQALDSDNKIAEGWWRLAVTYAQIGNKKMAIETINKAKSLNIEPTEEQQALLDQVMGVSSTQK